MKKTDRTYSHDTVMFDVARRYIDWCRDARLTQAGIGAAMARANSVRLIQASICVAVNWYRCSAVHYRVNVAPPFY